MRSPDARTGDEVSVQDQRLHRVIELALLGSTQAEIAEALGVSQPTVSRLITIARNAGLIPERPAEREKTISRSMPDEPFLEIVRNPYFLAGVSRLAREYGEAFRERYSFDDDDLRQIAFEHLLGQNPGQSIGYYLQGVEWSLLKILRKDHGSA